MDDGAGNGESRIRVIRRSSRWKNKAKPRHGEDAKAEPEAENENGTGLVNSASKLKL